MIWLKKQGGRVALGWLLFLAVSCQRGGAGPLSSLCYPYGGKQACYRAPLPPSPLHPRRHFEEVFLDGGELGTVHIAVSLPEEIPSEGLPAALVVSSYDMGAEALGYLKEHGPWAVVVYSYPDGIRESVEGLGLGSVRQLVQGAYRIPAQLLLVSDWLRRQSWSDGEPVSMIGISLGGVVLPATFHLANCCGHSLGPSVIAYSGAALYPMLYQNFTFPWPFKGGAAFVGTALLNGLEPAGHWPCVRGDFLVVHGLCDERIPRVSQRRLDALVPEGTQWIELPNPHISRERLEIVEELYQVSRGWLEERRREKKG